MSNFRLRQVASWLLLLAAVALARAFGAVAVVALIPIVALRPDLNARGYSTYLASKYRWAVLGAGAYTVVGTVTMLVLTLSRDTRLGSELGLSAMFLLLWPLAIVAALTELHLFRRNGAAWPHE